MTTGAARSEAAIFETLMLAQLLEPVAGECALGGVGCSYLAESVAAHDGQFGDVLARLLEHRRG
jgi:hypothetical protein